MEPLTKWIKEVLGIADLERQVRDLERHFVTKRDPATGAPTETLADVPLDKRKELQLQHKTRGMSLEQRRRWLEETDGGRIA